MLSLIGRRCAQAPSQAARSASASLASQHASLRQAPGHEYSASKIYTGEFPTHYTPAKDAPEHKSSALYRQGVTSQMQADYAPHQGRYDYGRLAHGRGLLRIFWQERSWVLRQGKNTLYVLLWLIPMLAAYEGRCAALQYRADHPEAPLAQPWYLALCRFFVF